MERKIVRMVIDTLGNPTIETQGYTGDQCTTVTAKLEAILSGSDAGNERFLKPEFFETNEGQKQTQEW